jgi:RHH-type rel operon transcriptional repressor/antitoxin RelB
MYSTAGEYPMLAIRLPEEIEQRLADLAAKTGRSKSFYAREAILAHLEELEDAYLGAERLKAPAKRWTQEELEAALDLGD